MNQLNPIANDSYFAVHFSFSSDGPSTFSFRKYPGLGNAVVLGEEGDAALAFSLNNITGPGCSGIKK